MLSLRSLLAAVRSAALTALWLLAPSTPATAENATEITAGAATVQTDTSHGAADRPQGEVLLSLRGPPGTTPVALTLAGLDALPQHSFTTSTQWTEGAIVFSGPALADVLALMPQGAARPADLRLIAANHYEVTLDPALLEPDVPILATRMNGKTFGLRDKGPLWVVFPFDRDTQYQNEGVFAASIWQLVEIRSDG